MVAHVTRRRHPILGAMVTCFAVLLVNGEVARLQVECDALWNGGGH
jgi:hypothetical protein